MRVWIGCLACYNAGRLMGNWYDASEAGSVTAERLHGSAAYLANVEARDGGSPHEEMWVMDTDETPHESLNREMSPQEAQDIADALDELERRHIDTGAWGAYVDNHGENFTDLDNLDGFEESYCGLYDSEEDYAQELAEELGAIPQDYSWPASYIDWDAATRDLFMECWSERAPGGQVYVFRSM